MPAAVIEYKDGTKKQYDFMRGGLYMAAQKARELLADEGSAAKTIYTTDWENDIDDILK